MNRFFLILIVFALAVTGGQDPGRRGEPLVRCVGQPGHVISGTITRYAPEKNIYLALYASGDDFEKARFCRAMRFAGDSLPADTIAFQFDSIPAGDYLIASYQDLDGDGKITRGMFGMPKDPYCIFRRNYGLFGPSWDKCRFRVDADFSGAHLILSK